ncbi:MAG: MFS transporter [Jiangellales bacterium]
MSRFSGLPDLPAEARVLLVGVAVNALGLGLVLPLLVVYLYDVRGFALDTVGLLAATPPVVAMVLLGPIGIGIDRLGPRRVQMVALVSSSLGATGLAFATTVPEAFISMAMLGVGQAAFWPASQALVAEVVPSPARPTYFGVSFALLNLGIGVGGVAAAFVAVVERPASFEWLYRLDALSFLVPLALLLGPLRHVGNRASTRVVTPGTYRDVVSDVVFRRFLLVVFASAFVGYGVIEAGWAGYARVVAEASTRTIGLAFAANTAMILALQLAALRFIDTRRRTSMLALMAGVWALAWLMLGAAGLVPGTAIATMLLVGSLAVFGAGETLLSPIVPAITNDLASDELRGRYNAVSSFAFQVAAVSAPIIAGLLLDRGWAGVFIGVTVGGCALLAVVALGLARHLPPTANGLAGGSGVADEVAHDLRAQADQR